MANNLPKFFYKYRSIIKHDNLDKDYAIDALFKCEAIFSNRTNFNDLFDSKIDILYPTPEQIISLSKITEDKQLKAFLNSLMDNTVFSKKGADALKMLEIEFNKVIDKYWFFCVSENCLSNLMWSHYADSHKGFCIEFKSDFIKADKVSYQKDIPKIEMIDFLASDNHRKNLSEKIWQSLRTKLDEWSYEEEYRFQMSNQMFDNVKEDNAKFKKIAYEPQFIESIIFGCRTPDNVKEFIMQNIPYKVKFKKSIEMLSTIKIVDY